MSKYNFNTSIPPINKKFISGLAQPTQTNIDTRSSYFPYSHFDFLVTPGETIVPSQLPPTNTRNGRRMVDCSEFNVINVDFNNNENDFDFFLQFNTQDDSGNAVTAFETKITENSKKHFSFPVQQQYMDFKIFNPNSSNTNANGVVSLSRFTQFNNHLQNENQSDQFTMNTCVRETNDFNEDIALLRTANIRQITVNGYMSSFSNTSPVLLGDGTSAVTLSNSAGTIVVSSSSASDTGSLIVEGVDQYYNFITETLTLNGTTTVTGSKSFRFINKATTNTNTGNINLTYNSNNLQISAGQFQLLHGLYSQKVKAKSVLKSYVINGTSGWDNNKIIIRKNSGDTYSTTIDEYKIINTNLINIYREPNLLLNPGDTIYIDIETPNGISPETYNCLTSSINLHEYSDNPVHI